MHEVEQIDQTVSLSRDALSRAKAVERMIRYSSRQPTGVRREASTGQMRQPPQIAAAVDVTSGVFHAFAIYELRSQGYSDIDNEQISAAAGTASSSRPCSRWHVYITDLFNMRHLVPGQTCWRPTVGSLLVNLLQRQARADHQVVVLKALSDANRLEGYYNRIGFTSSLQVFADAGLSSSYRDGEFIFQ